MKTRSVGLTGIAEHLKCSERDPGIIASPVINRPCARPGAMQKRAMRCLFDDEREFDSLAKTNHPCRGRIGFLFIYRGEARLRVLGSKRSQQAPQQSAGLFSSGDALTLLRVFVPVRSACCGRVALPLRWSTPLPIERSRPGFTLGSASFQGD
jgi:hypothetical protein